MKTLFVIGLVFGFTFCNLTGNIAQGKISVPAPSDTSGTQIFKTKKLKPKQMLKEHKPVKEKMDSRKLDTLNRRLFIPQRPLLRLKDSSQTIPQ